MSDRWDSRADCQEFFHAEKFLFLGCQRAALRGGHWRDQQHVRTLPIQFEIFRYPLPQDTRRKGPEAFAELDLQVHYFLHLWRPGVADNRTRPQRPRPEFHPATKPTDHFLGLN